MSQAPKRTRLICLCPRFVEEGDCRHVHAVKQFGRGVGVDGTVQVLDQGFYVVREIEEEEEGKA